MAEDSAARAALIQDWLAIWQSELTAVGADPETALVLESIAATWLQAAQAFDPHRARLASRSCSSADAPARATSAAAAAQPRDAEVERLRARLDELERRLAGIESDARDSGAGG